MRRIHMQFDPGYECRLNSACRFFAPLPSRPLCRCIEYGTAADNAMAGKCKSASYARAIAENTDLRGTK